MHHRTEKRATSPKRVQRAHEQRPLDAIEPVAAASAARLALEAAFSPGQPSSPHEPLEGPEVVIKRKRGLSSHAAVGQPSTEEWMEAQSAGALHTDRAPRVFRVTSRPTHQVQPEAAQSAVESWPDPVREKDLPKEEAASLPAAAARRSRRRAAPVVITRFAREIQAPQSIEVERPPLASGASGRAKAFVLQLPELAKSKRGVGTYVALRAEIDRLRALLAKAREREVARELKWIRAAIDEYDLNPADLGF
jgi:hypothetical protein